MATGRCALLLSGRAGSGKDTFAEGLADLSFHRVALADPLRWLAQRLFHAIATECGSGAFVGPDDLTDPKLKELPVEVELNALAVTADGRAARVEAEVAAALHDALGRELDKEQVRAVAVGAWNALSRAFDGAGRSKGADASDHAFPAACWRMVEVRRVPCGFARGASADAGSPDADDQELWLVPAEEVDGYGTPPASPLSADGLATLILEGRTMTPRRWLQWLGTDLCRMVLGEDVWIRAAVAEAAKHERVVFTDVRFANEAEQLPEHLSRLGFRCATVKLVDPAALPLAADCHVSEREQERMACNFLVVNNKGMGREALHGMARLIAERTLHNVGRGYPLGWGIKLEVFS